MTTVIWKGLLRAGKRPDVSRLEITMRPEKLPIVDRAVRANFGPTEKFEPVGPVLVELNASTTEVLRCTYTFRRRGSPGILGEQTNH